jgi:large subunit ribosomal protein L18
MLTKKEQRLRRAKQTRIRIAQQGAVRLTVNRTNLHIYANVISADGAKVLASASTAEKEVRAELGASGKGGNAAAAALIGKRIAEKAKAAGIEKKSRSIAPVSPTTVASRPLQMPPARPACSSDETGYTTWLSFRQTSRTKRTRTVFARR